MNRFQAVSGLFGVCIAVLALVVIYTDEDKRAFGIPRRLKF